MIIDLAGVTHHPAIVGMVDVLCNKTGNTDRGFFNVEAAYFLAKMASSMRATIVTNDRGEVPVNIYALALATSGYGKGHSVSIVEDSFLVQFKKRFMQDTMPVLADASLWRIANIRGAKAGTDPQEEYDSLCSEYKRAGAFPFTFDSGTTPAVKQLRHKLLLAECGSINLQIDEIGLNLIGATEVLTTFLELYDQGKVKQKLTKNTADNTRGEELDGKTPTNMLLFGTPSKLLDGGPTEELWWQFLETGYARRCLFGIGQQTQRAYLNQTPEEIYRHLTAPQNTSTISSLAAHFYKLADPDKFGWRMSVEEDVGIALIAYKSACEIEADKLADHEEIRKAELSHRYFKALKLAGAYAFVDESSEITMQHLNQAILLVEESGESFQSILNREKTYVKLAKYIATIGTEVTHADLLEALPFYKSGNAARNELMGLATAWGHKHHIVIKKTFENGIEFFRGETLKETNLDEIIISYSDNWAYEYTNETAPFHDLHLLTQSKGMHWANHHFKRGHRAEENTISGFNMITIDVDGGISLAACHELLKEYKFMTYTTKRHSETENRFRLMIPMNYELYLDTEEYREFMNNVMQWLPFETDESANQRCKKWESFDGGNYFINADAPLLDVRDFIPRTAKNEAFQQGMKSIESLDNLERWFAARIGMGNRNNNMLRFAMVLVDSGADFSTVSNQVRAFNKKLSNPLSDEELNSTILVSVAKKLATRGNP